MGRSQRQKGKKGELEVVHLARDAGFTDARRAGDAGQVDGDVGPIPGAYLEVRRREQLSIEAWAREVEAEAEARGRGEVPVLIFRTSGQPWRAELPAVDLLELFAERLTAAEADALLLPDSMGSTEAFRVGLTKLRRIAG